MKRVLSILLVIVLMFTFAACGRGSGSEMTWKEQYDLGMQYLMDGDYEAAIVAFTAAIEIDAKDIQAYTGLVQAYIGTGDYESAVTTAEQGAEVLGDSGQDQVDGAVEEFTAALLTLGELCLEDGQYELAITVFTLAIEIYPELVDAYIGRAEAYVTLAEAGTTGDGQDAAEVETETARGESNTTGDGQESIEAEADERQKALEDYQKALELIQEGETSSLTEDELEELIEKIGTSHVDVEEVIYVLTEIYNVYEDGSRELVHEYTYDESGSLLSSIEYGEMKNGPCIIEYFSVDGIEELPLYMYTLDDSGEVVETYEYVYDDKGNLISEVIYDALGVGTVQSEYSYTYDDYGNILIKNSYENISSERDFHSYEYHYAYDLDGNILNIVTISDGSDQIRGETNYTYDDNGNLVLCVENTYTEGIVTGQYETVYTYDDNENLISCVKSGYSEWSGNNRYETIYTYDDSGNVLSYIYVRSYYNGEGQVTSRSESTTIYTYDDYDTVISVITYYLGDEQSREVYSYDEHGNMATESSYSYGELLGQYEYVYTAISR